MDKPSFAVTGKYNAAADDIEERQRVLEAVISGLESIGLAYTPGVNNRKYSVLDTAMCNITVFGDGRIFYKLKDKDWTCEIPRNPQQASIDSFMKILEKMMQRYANQEPANAARDGWKFGGNTP